MAKREQIGVEWKNGRLDRTPVTGECGGGRLCRMLDL